MPVWSSYRPWVMAALVAKTTNATDILTAKTVLMPDAATPIAKPKVAGPQADFSAEDVAMAALLCDLQLKPKR